MDAAAASGGPIEKPLMPKSRGGLEIRVLEGSRKGIGAAKQRAKSIDAAKVGVRDVREEGRDLRNVIDEDKRFRMAHKLTIFEKPPAPRTQKEHGVVDPQRGGVLGTTLLLLESLRDERGKPARKEAPSPRSETLLEPIGARRAARISPDLDGRKRAAAQTGSTSAANSVERDYLLFNSTDPIAVTGGNGFKGTLTRLGGLERRKRQRAARQGDDVLGRAKMPLEALARRT